jgi:prepilin-type N-terminal cleavage/methylation domain-containing protein
MKARASEAGFTLIEILVSIMIFGLLTTSVFYFLSQQNSMSTRANDGQRGLSLAKLVLDSLKVAPYDSLVAGTDTVDERFIRSWHISVVTDEDGHSKGNKQVDLTVHWPIAGTYSVSLATLVSDERFREESSP